VKFFGVHDIDMNYRYWSLFVIYWIKIQNLTLCLCYMLI